MLKRVVLTKRSSAKHALNDCPSKDTTPNDKRMAFGGYDHFWFVEGHAKHGALDGVHQQIEPRMNDGWLLDGWAIFGSVDGSGEGRDTGWCPSMNGGQTSTGCPYFPFYIFVYSVTSWWLLCLKPMMHMCTL